MNEAKNCIGNVPTENHYGLSVPYARKRPRTQAHADTGDGQEEESMTNSELPSHRNRGKDNKKRGDALIQANAGKLIEMKYMFTNAPARSIASLPTPFKTAIQSSNLWKWERHQGLETTGCLATLFPKDDNEDVSCTFWVGHDDGYHLNDQFELKCVMSS